MSRGTGTIAGAVAAIALLASCSTTVDEGEAVGRESDVAAGRDLVRTTITDDAQALATALGAESVHATGGYQLNRGELTPPDVVYTADAVIRMPLDAVKPYSFAVRDALADLGYDPSLQFSTIGGGGGGQQRDGLRMSYGESDDASYRDVRLSFTSSRVKIPDSLIDRYDSDRGESIFGDPADER